MIEDLKKYTSAVIYPLHMPGHKRNPLFGGALFPLDIDLTEVYGTDNLHSPESIIKAAEQRAARLWGAADSYILVNGSTCGVLASIFSATKPGSAVLVDRGSHTSVFNAAELRNLKPYYLMPDYDEATGIRAGISLNQVKVGLDNCPSASACIITSPTYEGAVCDIQGIADICHEHGIPLIVDSAHGAHFGFSDYFPESAVKCGADAVIMSLHKTLPALTQTALLHINGNLIERSLVRKYLAVFETSSPSYILMSSADYCTEMLENNSESLFTSYEKNLDSFYKKTAGLSALSLPYAFSSPFFAFDRGKIVVFCGNCDISGYELQGILRERYKLETEMAAVTFVLAISSVCDTPEGLERFAEALIEIDSQLSVRNTHRLEFALPTPVSIFTPSEAAQIKKRSAKTEENVGMISGGTVFSYPPGIPILLPGEKITPEVIAYIKHIKASGGKISGEESILDTPQAEISPLCY